LGYTEDFVIELRAKMAQK